MQEMEKLLGKATFQFVTIQVFSPRSVRQPTFILVHSLFLFSQFSLFTRITVMNVGSNTQLFYFQYQKRFSKIFLFFFFFFFFFFSLSFWLPWQPELWMELNSLNNLVEVHPRNIPPKFQDWPSA